VPQSGADSLSEELLRFVEPLYGPAHCIGYVAMPSGGHTPDVGRVFEVAASGATFLLRTWIRGGENGSTVVIERPSQSV
jgi:hypothetical protein